jgi:hypothetical protein
VCLLLSLTIRFTRPQRDKREKREKRGREERRTSNDHQLVLCHACREIETAERRRRRYRREIWIDRAVGFRLPRKRKKKKEQRVSAESEIPERHRPLFPLPSPLPSPFPFNLVLRNAFPMLKSSLTLVELTVDQRREREWRFWVTG